MEEVYRQAMIKLRGMWQFRWLGLITAWIVGAAGVVAVLLMPDRFEASARIFVNTASILKPLMSGLTVMQNEDQQIAMLSRVVISRPNVEKLVQLAGMDAEAKSKEQFDALVDRVSSRLQIMGSGRDNIYTLGYRGTNPERAKRIVQLFSTMFIESGHGGKATDTDAARKFIDEQIAIYEKKLQEAENRLKEFKLKSLNQGAGEVFPTVSQVLIGMRRFPARYWKNPRFDRHFSASGAFRRPRGEQNLTRGPPGACFLSEPFVNRGGRGMIDSS